VNLVADGAAEDTTVSGRVRALQREVDAICAEYDRPAGSVRILGATKGQPRERVLEAIAAGLTDIGENYVQEAETKYAELPPVTRHYIGHVQTNKAKAIVAGFDVVQSIDRPAAGEAIARVAASAGRSLRVLIQVNVSARERYGIAPEDAPLFAERLRARGLLVDGLMTIGPVTDDREEICKAFALAARTFAIVRGSTLSMGMSGDWREAIAAGATMIRLGTAIFGARI
jgi:hypothetical protein